MTTGNFQRATYKARILITLAQGIKENVFVVSIPDYGFTPFGAERKDSMQKNLDYAAQFNKQANDPKLDQHLRDKAKDQIAHFGREAAEDEKLLKIMQDDKQKMLKSNGINFNNFI